MDTITSGRRKKGGFPTVLVVLLVAFLAVGGYAWYSTKKKHDAALAYCGATAYQTWRTQFNEATQDFDRTAEAAGLSPRMNLAPLILRMSDAKAKAEALTPIPCAADGAKLVTDSMVKRIDGFSLFAVNGDEIRVQHLLRTGKKDGDQGAQLIFNAEPKTVK